MRLYQHPGWGSAIVELQLTLYGLPYELVEAGDLLGDPAARDRLAPLNPVAQVPTLVTGDGLLMTESAAITLWLADLTGSELLVPAPGDPVRPAFLRWLVFLVANIYPCFTFADLPGRFVPVAEAEQPFADEVQAHMERLWRSVGAAAAGPWFLGERFSAIDLYLAVMTRWRPKRPWFAANAPLLHAAALAAEADPRLAAVVQRNWPSAQPPTV